MFDRNNSKPMDRTLFITDDISVKSVNDIIKEIIKINKDDSEKEQEYVGFKREPIQLFIYSYGGTCYAGFALIDIIKTSKTPVHTITIGCAMSMGLAIYMSGHRRFIGENAVLLFHDVSGGVGDSAPTEYFKQTLDEMLRIQKQNSRLITEGTLVTDEMLQDYITRKAEWYIPAEEAIRLKIAHEYYK